MKAIIGIKKDMTQVFDNESGDVIPCTVIDVNDVVVVNVRKEEKDGYNAVILGKDRARKSNKAQSGAYKDLGYSPKYVKEVRLEELDEGQEAGREMNSDMFTVGDVVTVSGESKGKGFQGVIKRWGFSGGPKTHGQSDRHRAPGSIGSGTTPGRVWKGKKMPGRTGGNKKTVKSLKIVKVVPEKGLICISGSVPGSKDSLVIIQTEQHNEPKD